MAGAQVLPPFPVFTDVDGNPVDDGYIYVGQEGLDPIASPVSVFWDRALTVPATQPIRTIGGYPSNAGVRSVFYSSEPVYSILVRNKNGTEIYSDSSSLSSTDLESRLADSTDPSKGAGMVGYDGSTVFQKFEDEKLLKTAKRFVGTASDDSGTPDAVFKVVRTHSLATSPHGFREQTTFNPSAPAVAAACFDAALESVGSQNIDHTIGFQARLTHSGSGTIANLYGGGSFNIINGPVSNAYAYYAQDRINVPVGLLNGAYFRPAIFADVTNAYGFVHAPAINTGNVTNSIGFRVETADGAGTLTNEYGVYIKALTKGSNKVPLHIETTAGTNYIGTKTKHDALFQVGGSALLNLGGSSGSAFPGIHYNYDPVLNQFIATAEASGFLWSGTNFSFRHALSGTAGTIPTFTTLLNIRTTNDANYKAVFPGADNTQQLGLSTVRWAQTYSREFRPGSGAPIWTSGIGTPEGAVTAPIGSMFTRTDGGPNTTLYVKESGAGNTGWVAK